jgi:hypothetical protein
LFKIYMPRINESSDREPWEEMDKLLGGIEID